MNTGDLSDAIVLATNAHRNQVDKGGTPYILHPLRVMQAVRGDAERIAAVLHDTMEDCGVPWLTIARGFGSDVADAVSALSRDPEETYESFILRCAQNPIARVVKLADIADNMDVTRLGREPTAQDASRLERYAAARAVLMAASAASLPVA